MSKPFILNVSGAYWYAHSDQTIGTMPQALIMKLAGEIKSWYEGLPESLQEYVREVTVKPLGGSTRFPDMVSSIHVGLETYAVGHPDLIVISSRSKGFIYDPETELVGAGNRDGGHTLHQSLNNTLRSILAQQITWLETVRKPMQHAVDTLRHPGTKN